MNVPNWYSLTLLALAAFRTWRLLAVDDILNVPRRYVTRLPKGWKEGDPVPANYNYALPAFIACPWCLGFWLSLAWWGLWQAWPHGTLVAASVAAVSALVPLADRLTSD